MTAPSEIPKRLYDLIQKVAKLSESVKLNSNNSDPKTSVMAHIPKPPTPLKPKPKPKPKMKKKKIKITWSSYNYHGSYPMNKDEQKIWNLFIVTDKAAIEQGIRGVYETRVECINENGKMTLQNFVLTEREPKDGSSDPQDFYQVTGTVHRLTESAGFNYHNPVYSPHILIYCGCRDKKASSFE
nr:40S ribosomal protein S13 [Tanacetum cinerariifolium]